MKVTLSKHAKERIATRTNTLVNFDKDVVVDITNAIYTRKYRNKDHGYNCMHYVVMFKKTPVVLCVDVDNKVVNTVMTEGPVVDQDFKKARHILAKRSA